MRLPVLIVLATLMLSGCTSKLVVGPLYNRLDDQMRGEFHKLGKFNEEQIAHFETRVGHFHVWHRQVELPRYAQLLSDIRASIKEPGNTTRFDIQNWIDTAESFTRSARDCHPVNFSYDLMQTLTDPQVTFIEKRFARERRKNFARYNSRTPEERQNRRYANIAKWAGRANFEFTNKQKALLKETMTRQISMRPQYYRAANSWAESLFKLVRQQDNPNFENEVAMQLGKLWTLLENAHPRQWQANRDLWQDFGMRFVTSLTKDQRIKLNTFLRKISKTINAISKDKPSFKPSYDPDHGCSIPLPE